MVDAKEQKRHLCAICEKYADDLKFGYNFILDNWIIEIC
jgi:hypothetical protein